MTSAASRHNNPAWLGLRFRVPSFEPCAALPNRFAQSTSVSLALLHSLVLPVPRKSRASKLIAKAQHSRVQRSSSQWLEAYCRRVAKFHLNLSSNLLQSPVEYSTVWHFRPVSSSRDLCQKAVRRQLLTKLLTLSQARRSCTALTERKECQADRIDFDTGQCLTISSLEISARALNWNAARLRISSLHTALLPVPCYRQHKLRATARRALWQCTPPRPFHHA